MIRNTALHCAALAGHARVARILLDADADLTLRTNWHVPPRPAHKLARPPAPCAQTGTSPRALRRTPLHTPRLCTPHAARPPACPPGPTAGALRGLCRAAQGLHASALRGLERARGRGAGDGAPLLRPGGQTP